MMLVKLNRSPKYMSTDLQSTSQLIYECSTFGVYTNGPYLLGFGNNVGRSARSEKKAASYEVQEGSAYWRLSWFSSLG